MERRSRGDCSPKWSIFSTGRRRRSPCLDEWRQPFGPWETRSDPQPSPTRGRGLPGRRTTSGGDEEAPDGHLGVRPPQSRADLHWRPALFRLVQEDSGRRGTFNLEPATRRTNRRSSASTTTPARRIIHLSARSGHCKGQQVTC